MLAEIFEKVGGNIQRRIPLFLYSMGGIKVKMVIFLQFVQKHITFGYYNGFEGCMRGNSGLEIKIPHINASV